MEPAAVGEGGSAVTVLQDGPYAVSVATDVMVTMRDGVQLAVDLYLPAETGDADAMRWPCLLDRKRVVEGQGVSVRVDLGGRRILKNKSTQLSTYVDTVT